jgi:hypothetical protein
MKGGYGLPDAWTKEKIQGDIEIIKRNESALLSGSFLAFAGAREGAWFKLHQTGYWIGDVVQDSCVHKLEKNTLLHTETSPSLCDSLEVKSGNRHAMQIKDF